MALEAFTLATIAEMDGGRIRAAFEMALRRLEADCKDRPGVESARKLALVPHMTPVCDGGDLDSVNITFKITDTVPKRESKSYNMQAVPGGLLFNDASPEDVRQGTLDMARKQKARRVKGNESAEPDEEEKSDVG